MLNGSTIVFDLDGTLIDTAPDLTNALNHALSGRGYPSLPPEAVRAAVGRGARVTIERAFKILDIEDDVDAMLEAFLAHYEANIAAESRPFPGAIDALERLRSGGARLAICTNKREKLSRMLLQAFDIDHYFAAIGGRDTLGLSKPDPGHVTGTIALAGGDATRAVMIGDSGVDIEAAQGAGVPTILVSFGYAPPPPGGPVPDAVIDHFDALDAAVRTLLAPRERRAAAPS